MSKAKAVFQSIFTPTLLRRCTGGKSEVGSRFATEGTYGSTTYSADPEQTYADPPRACAFSITNVADSSEA